MKKENKNRMYWGAVALYFLILIVVHSRIVTGTNDDAWFAAVLDRYDLLSYLRVRYMTWTSRLPTEALLVYLTRWPSWIWKGLNICFFMLLVYELAAIWGEDEETQPKAQLFFAVFLFLLPVQMHNGAGWITTTMNYLWPVTLGFLPLILLRKWETGKRICSYEYPVCAIGCFLGSFQEQTAAVLFVLFLLYAIGRRIQRQKMPLFGYMLCLITFGVLVFTLTCPGNAARSAAETQTWFPEFASYTIGEKILTGFLRTCSFYITCESGNLYFLLILSALFALTLIERKSVFLCLTGAYSWLITFVSGFCGTVFNKFEIDFRLPFSGLLQNTELPEINAAVTWMDIALECVLFSSVLGCVVVLLYSVFGNNISQKSVSILPNTDLIPDDLRPESPSTDRIQHADTNGRFVQCFQRNGTFCMLFLMLAASLCSGFIMGFSPTVYASGGRVFLLGSLIQLGILYTCTSKLPVTIQNSISHSL
ncbi:MAG: DUF6056 family protein [Clostridiales bacterium]|nr:DUF6056 family protein [Clostridiales bacterium]